jgi:hypothetical protein
MMLPDRFIDQGTPAGQMADAGLDAASIVAKVRETLEAIETYPAEEPVGRRVQSPV